MLNQGRGGEGRGRGKEKWRGGWEEVTRMGGRGGVGKGGRGGERSGEELVERRDRSVSFSTHELHTDLL